MTALLLLRGLARGKARFACAALGVAAATGAVVFVFSLAATNSAQGPELARRAAAPWAAWRVEGDFQFGRRGMRREAKPDAGKPESADAAAAPAPARGGAPDAARRGPPRPRLPEPDLALRLVATTLDYRPGGRVLQGPPMRAIVAEAPAENPWGCTRLSEGRWPDPGSARHEVVCTRDTLRRFGRGEAPPVGTSLKFVGAATTMTAEIVGYLDEAKLPPAWPSTFAHNAAFAALAAEKTGTLSLFRAGSGAEAAVDGRTVFSPASEQVVEAFKGDENRRMDYARPLLLAAAVLTALALLVNSLLLAVEANRRPLAVLRTAGLSKGGVVRLVAAESLAAVAAGWILGAAGALAALRVYVAADPATFPAGPAPLGAFSGILAATAAIGAAVAAAAVLFALRPALSVRPLDALAARPRKRRRGMATAFAFGFGAFVAVEVWGASLMRCFVPSPEWPDAIVSLLPSGVDPLDRPKADGLPGVARVTELYPLQLAFDPPEPMAGPFASAGRGGPAPLRNALFLGAEWLPRFRYVEGDAESAEKAVFSGRACVIAEMLARARSLHAGDVLRVRSGRREGEGRLHELPIAGVVDLNWHMVTSRGLVRGLSGAPNMADGVAFVSIDTANWLDPRPMLGNVNMTHLWIDFDKDFLRENGVFPAGRKVEAAIAEAFGNPDGATVRLHARDEIADGTLAHGWDVIGQAARVPFAFLAILSIGFVAMLVADADAARGEMATLRAVGATRLQLSWRLARGAAAAALRGMVFAVPLGALAGWLFSFKTGAIWAGLPKRFAFPLRLVLEGGAGSVAFALAVAVPTALVLVSRARARGEGR